MNNYLGYGNIAPATFPGRMFCLLFGIIGIPFTLSVIADVGGIFANILTKFWGAHGQRVRNLLGKFQRKNDHDEEDDDDEEEDLFDNNFLTAFLSLLFLFVFLCFGAGLFTLYEDWCFLDAFYFCFITMTTIGFGDLVPGEFARTGLDRANILLVFFRLGWKQQCIHAHLHCLHFHR